MLLLRYFNLSSLTRAGISDAAQNPRKAVASRLIVHTRKFICLLGWSRSAGSAYDTALLRDIANLLARSTLEGQSDASDEPQKGTEELCCSAAGLCRSLGYDDGCYLTPLELRL